MRGWGGGADKRAGHTAEGDCGQGLLDGMDVAWMFFLWPCCLSGVSARATCTLKKNLSMFPNLKKKKLEKCIKFC